MHAFVVWRTVLWTCLLITFFSETFLKLHLFKTTQSGLLFKIRHMVSKCWFIRNCWAAFSYSGLSATSSSSVGSPGSSPHPAAPCTGTRGFLNSLWPCNFTLLSLSISFKQRLIKSEGRLCTVVWANLKHMWLQRLTQVCQCVCECTSLLIILAQKSRH